MFLKLGVTFTDSKPLEMFLLLTAANIVKQPQVLLHVQETKPYVFFKCLPDKMGPAVFNFFQEMLQR